LWLKRVADKFYKQYSCADGSLVLYFERHTKG